jgi:integrase/recombinase XerC
METASLTIHDSIEKYLEQIRRSKSPRTAITYRRALAEFSACLERHQVAVDDLPIETLDPKWLEWLIGDLQDKAIATERLYTTAVSSYYKYVAAQEWKLINLATVSYILGERRKQGQRLPIFPEKGIERTLAFALQHSRQSFKEDRLQLAALRDAALLVTLADTGLRVSEACHLHRGDIDWERNRAVIIGKGDKQAVVRFSQRSLRQIRAYLSARQLLDGQSGRLSILPLFARHDKGAGKRILPLSSRSAELIIEAMVIAALGQDAKGTITPHSFRHFFVTRVARDQGLLMAKQLARHESLQTTSGYTHLVDKEVDEAYKTVFDRDNRD